MDNLLGLVKNLSPLYEALLLQAIFLVDAGSLQCLLYAGKEMISQLTNMRAGNKCQSTGKLFLSNVNYHFVKGKSLCLVNSNSPC